MLISTVKLFILIRFYFFVMQDNLKNYPASSPEVAKMLRLQPQRSSESLEGVMPQEKPSSVSAGDLPVAGLPVAPIGHFKNDKDDAQAAIDLESRTEEMSEKPIDKAVAALKKKYTVESEKFPPENFSRKETQRPLLVKYLKLFLPYLAVFVLGLVLYYFFFSNANFNFGQIFRSQPKVQSAKQSALASLQQENLKAYYQWISEFYFDVSDPKVIDPNADNSGNGLSNFQKFLLNLNPKSYDTLGLGMADSEAIAKNINPLTGNGLTNEQKRIIDQYIDLEVIMNRLALENLQRSRNVAGASTFGGLISQKTGNKLTPRTEMTPSVETTAPVNVEPVNGNAIDVNTDIPGRLEIPSLKINVPIIWTKDPKDFENDLRSGVVHYPGTALPGQIGTSYISGHSSNYVWAKGDYKKVFSKLGDLPDNTSFKVTVVQKNGRDAILNYVVTHRQEFLPTDQEQFRNTGKSVMALSTCWPPGSTAKRLVVFGELTQVTK